MSKHTPGPWRFDGRTYIWGPKSEMIAMIRGTGEGLPEADNARLIAAAPLIAQAGIAALFLCESLLAVREGASDELIREIRDALKVSIETAGLELRP